MTFSEFNAAGRVLPLSETKSFILFLSCGLSLQEIFKLGDVFVNVVFAPEGAGYDGQLVLAARCLVRAPGAGFKSYRAVLVFNDCEKKPFIFFGIVDFQTDVVLAVRIQQKVVQPFKGKVPVAAGNLQPVFSLNVQMQVNVAEIAVIVMFLGGKHVHPGVELVNVYPFQYAVKTAWYLLRD